jgi:glycosyltransferase involved in cell wall biosynthesis
MKSGKKENSEPLISVIVTTYNRSDLVGETINSILNQTYWNIELIVVDDGSTDNTEDIINSFQDKRIIYLKTANWGAPAGPRNIGIKKAKGEYIAFCDDDDLWYINKLEIQLKVLINDDNLVGVGSNVSLIGKTIMSRERTSKKDNRIDFLSALMCNRCSLSSLMVMKSKILFNTVINFNAVEDFDFQLQYLLTTGKEIIKLKQPLVYYRVHSENISSNSSNLSILLNALNVLSNYESIIDKTVYKNSKSLVYSTAGIKLLKMDKNKLSRNYLITSFRLTKNPKQKVKTMVLILGSYFPSFLRGILRGYYRLSAET